MSSIPIHMKEDIDMLNVLIIIIFSIMMYTMVTDTKLFFTLYILLYAIMIYDTHLTKKDSDKYE